MIKIYYILIKAGVLKPGSIIGMMDADLKEHPDKSMDTK